jgi:hypothetical protein
LSNLNFALTKSEKLIIRTQYANTGKFDNMDDARQFMKFVRSRLGSATRAIINTDSKYTLANEPIRHVSEFSQVFPGQKTLTRENLMFKTFTTRDACDKEYMSMLQVHHPVPCSYFCRPVECVDFSHKGHTAHLLVMPSFGHHVLIKPQDFELVLASLCAMLLTFHLKELCYGDLKPQHVFVTQAGVRVIDGGSICAIGKELKSSTDKYSLDATNSGVGSVALDFVCLATTMYEILYGNAFAGADVEIEARTINGMCLALERKRFSNPYGLLVDLKEQELDNTRIDMMIAALDGPITLSSYLNPSSIAGVDPQIDAVRSSITLTLEDLVGEATDSELPLTLIQLIVSFLY